MKHTLPLACLLLFSGTLAAAELESSAPKTWDWRFGGDLRLRYDFTNNLPTEKHTEKGHTDYARVRARLWSKLQTGNLELYLRVADEFRYYNSRESDKGKQRFPDVLFIDNLYLKYTDLFGLMDVKLGRQDMAFGAKRIISDGQGGDGSRSTSFDAARLTFKFSSKRTLDAFAIYQAREDWLPTLGKTHDAKSKHTKGYNYDTTGYNQNEYGAGLYYTDKSNTSFPWEAYYVWKVEQGHHSKALAKGETSFNTHTFGIRLLPKFTDTLSGEAELAVQTGDDSLAAAMAYGGLTYAPALTWKPKFTFGVQYMSGDEEGWRGDNAWLPVFNRETGVGEAVAPMFNKYAYTNFLYPHLKIGLTPAQGHAITFQTGPMFAPVREDDGHGGSYGTFRGYYASVKYAIDLNSLFAQDWLKGAGLAFTGEYLSKGDYFADGSDNDALFGRVELTYKF